MDQQGGGGQKQNAKLQTASKCTLGGIIVNTWLVLSLSFGLFDLISQILFGGVEKVSPEAIYLFHYQNVGPIVQIMWTMRKPFVFRRTLWTVLASFTFELWSER